MSENNKAVPWLKFDFEVFFESDNVSAMCDEAVGLYMRILRYAWKHGGAIPTDKKKLMNIFRVTKHKFNVLWPEIEPCFVKEGEKFFQKRLKENLEELENNFQQRSDTGRENAIKGWELRRSRIATAKVGAIQDSENSELRTESLKSSVDSVNRPPLNIVGKTEPIKNLPPKTQHSQKTCLDISRTLNAHKKALSADVLVNSPLVKKLFMALISVPNIDPESQRLLAYIIQAKEAKNPKDDAERLSYAIMIIKAPKFAPADSLMREAKHMMGLWRDQQTPVLDKKVIDLMVDKTC